MCTRSKRSGHPLVLAPLDGVEVNALLDEFPKWAELAQEGDTFLDRLENVVDLHVGGETTDTESDTAVGALIAVAECAEHVTGLQRSRSTSATRGQGNILQGHQEGLAFHVGK